MYPTSRRIAVVAVTLILLVTVMHPPRWLRSATRTFTSGRWGLAANQISGRVVDANSQEPVTGAAVTIAGTTAGGTTGDDGTFTLPAQPGARTLTIRRIGYLAQAVPLEPGESYFPVSLKRDVLRLESQVVTSVAASVAPMAANFRAKALPEAPGASDDGLGWLHAATTVSGDATAMIVRTGTASVEVSTIDSAVPRVRALAVQIGGYVANSSVEGGREQARSATLEVKAPAAAFERLLSGLNPLGKVESVNISAADVGEEFVDVEARITNDHRLEARLIELLATRTGKLKDVLDVEQELARVREEIERYEGRLRYLRAHTEMSTLSITIHEPVPIIEHVGTNPIVVAARQAWRNFIALLALVIASMGVLLPVAAVAGAIYWTHSFARSRSQTT